MKDLFHKLCYRKSKLNLTIVKVVDSGAFVPDGECSGPFGLYIILTLSTSCFVYFAAFYCYNVFHWLTAFITRGSTLLLSFVYHSRSKQYTLFTIQKPSIKSKKNLCLRHRQIIDLLATDKSRYFARPRPIIVNAVQKYFAVHKL